MSAQSTLFHGPLAARFAEFVDLMKITGGTHVSLLSTLRRLDGYLLRKHPTATTLTRQIVEDWCKSFGHLRPASQQRYRCAISKFCAFLRARDPATIPEHALPPVRTPRDFLPCVLSEEQIVDVLSRARALRTSTRNPLRPQSVYLVLVLLYTAGLRIGEVIRLTIGDFDATAGTLLIRETKFSKTRLVPIAWTTQRAVSAYLNERSVRGIDSQAQASLVFSPGRRQLCRATIEGTIRRLFREAGIKPEQGRVGPRPHDLRHTFAAHRVLAWYRSGEDLNARLPLLSTYLGHRNLESTQHYLNVLPGILEEASHRFEQQRAPWGVRP